MNTLNDNINKTDPIATYFLAKIASLSRFHLLLL